MKFYGAALFLTHTVMVMTADTCGGCGDGAYASSRVLRRICGTLPKNPTGRLHADRFGSIKRGRPKRDFGRSLCFIIDKDVHITFPGARSLREGMVY